MRDYTFSPAWGRGKVLATSTTTSRTEVGSNNNVICITNQDDTNGMYVRAGDATVVAALAVDYYLPPNGSLTITKKRSYTHVAAIAVAATPSLHVIPGEGI
jgi:hypothetical protein